MMGRKGEMRLRVLAVFLTLVWLATPFILISGVEVHSGGTTSVRFPNNLLAGICLLASLIGGPIVAAGLWHRLGGKGWSVAAVVFFALIAPFPTLSIVAFSGHRVNRLIKTIKRGRSSKDTDVMMASIEASTALREIKDPRAVEPLIRALKDKDNDIRETVVYALGEIKDARAVEPLTHALKDEDSRVRSSAAVALGKIKDARAVELLIAASQDTDKEAREDAAAQEAPVSTSIGT